MLQIHDKFFKLFKDVLLAKQLLSMLLPKEICELLDWETLKITDSESLLTNKSVFTDIIVKIRLRSGEPLVIYLPMEHKSYPDQNVIVQVLEQFTAICKKTKSIVVPIIILCCKDKTFSIPNSYLRWVLRDYDLSTPEMQKLINWLPDFRCIVVNLQNIESNRLWQAGIPGGLLAYTMANFWAATEDTVAKIIEKIRELNLKEYRYLVDSLIDYYKHTDKKYGRKEFDRIERQRWPNLAEEELLMPEILLGQERIHKEGVDKGIILGRKEGIDLGRKEGVDEGIALGRKEGVNEGIALGRKEGVNEGIILGRKKGVDEGIILGRSEERENLILDMLKSGKMTDNMICEITGISKTELAKLKIKVEN